MSRYSEVLNRLEDFRAELLQEHLDEERRNLQYGSVDKSQNINDFKPLLVNGYPVLHFRYEGAMPLYKEKDKEYLALIRNYYYQSTIQTYDLGKMKGLFEGKVVLFFQHIFKNNGIRDIDNRNRKYIIDAIRFTRLIPDDDFLHISIMEEGVTGKGLVDSSFVNLFIIEEQNFADFYTNRSSFTFRNSSDFAHIMTLNDFEKLSKLKSDKDELVVLKLNKKKRTE